MLHTNASNAPGGSCSSASTSSAASTVSSASVGSDVSNNATHRHHHHHHQQQQQQLQQQHHSSSSAAPSPSAIHSTASSMMHHSRRPSTSSSINTVTTDASVVSSNDPRNAMHPHNPYNQPTRDESSASAATAKRRLRTVRLTRPCASGASRRVALQLATGSAAAAASVGVGTLKAASFGFAVRGGREYGIGFFVSRVDRNGEADVRGLKVGDQLIRVNGYAVDDAVHRELSQYIACQDRLTLKVRGVGILPVKDRQSDPLSWHSVPGANDHHNAVANNNNNSNLPLVMPRCCAPEAVYACQDVRITLEVEPRTKLGLGICKGPEWKPGIFVQFTKDASVARDAGLRPGDQLLSCNGIDFADVLFSEAVSVMKASQHLEMIVRTAAGAELFPGESSGYNSSASSVTGGDQSPCWGDQASKRLSMVREETTTDGSGSGPATTTENRTAQQAFWAQQQRTDHDRRVAAGNAATERRLHSVQPPVVPANYRPANASSAAQQPPQQASNDGNAPAAQSTNTTIIKLSETGTIINNTMVPLIADKSADRRHQQQQHQTQQQQQQQQGTLTRNTNSTHHQLHNSGHTNTRVNFSQPNATATNKTHSGDSQMADIRFVSRKIETKTVTVEVHRGTDADAIAPKPAAAGKSPAPPPPPPPPMPTSPAPMSLLSCASSDDGAHSSLLSATISTADVASLSSAISEELKKRAERVGTYEVNPSRCQQQQQPTSNAVASNGNGRIALKKVRSTFGEVGPNSEDKHNALIDEFKLAHRKMFRNAAATAATAPATPDDADNQPDRQLELRGCQQQQQNADPPPQSQRQRFDKAAGPYPCSPSPDYDDPYHQQQQQQPDHTGTATTGTMGRRAAHAVARATGDAAELQSIDSYKLTNPASPAPKPPASYFQSAATGPATLKKAARPVAVTIGEYGGARKDTPKQFDFIGSANCGTSAAGVDVVDNQGGSGGGGGSKGVGDVSHRLKNELESTLSRSNLRTRTDNVVSNSNTNGVVHPASTHRSVSLNATSTAASKMLPGQNNNFKPSATAARPTLHKTQSNVEKITAMLVSQNLMGSRPAPQQPQPHPAPSSVISQNGQASGTRVTINVNGNNAAVACNNHSNGSGSGSPPINGILKNTNNNNNNGAGAMPSSSAATSTTALSSEQRNITFGNITTVMTDNL